METPVNDLLDKITSKDVVDLENETFVNNLDEELIKWFSLNVRELPEDKGKYIIDCYIRFYKCEFKGDLDFSNFHFRKAIIIQESIFEGDLNFTNARFESGIIFDHNILNGNAIFFLAHFKKYAHFIGTKGLTLNKLNNFLRFRYCYTWFYGIVPLWI